MKRGLLFWIALSIITPFTHGSATRCPTKHGTCPYPQRDAPDTLHAATGLNGHYISVSVYPRKHGVGT